MKSYRADYLVKPDLVIDGEESLLPIVTKNGFKVTFKNCEKNEQEHFTRLIAIVVGTAQNIDVVNNIFRRELANALDLLAFATHSRFQILHPLKVLDWEPRQRERAFKIFHSSDFRDPPDPELNQDLLDTVSKIEEFEIKDFVRTALKYFRYGVLEKSPEDQFMRFWLALEILAENTKIKEPELVKCFNCEHSLVCKSCSSEITRVPMAKSQIINLLRLIVGEENIYEVSKRLFIARNSLMHGGSVQSIEKKTNRIISEISDELGNLLWQLVYGAIEGLSAESVVFGFRGGNFTNQTITASSNGIFWHEGESDHPSDEVLNGFKVSLITNFKPKNL